MTLLELFVKPSARTLAKRDLEEAERWLHHYKGQQEEAAAQVQKYERRIKRIRTELSGDAVALPQSQSTALAVVNG